MKIMKEIMIGEKKSVFIECFTFCWFDLRAVKGFVHATVIQFDLFLTPFHFYVFLSQAGHHQHYWREYSVHHESGSVRCPASRLPCTGGASWPLNPAIYLSLPLSRRGALSDIFTFLLSIFSPKPDYWCVRLIMNPATTYLNSVLPAWWCGDPLGRSHFLPYFLHVLSPLPAVFTACSAAKPVLHVLTANTQPLSPLIMISLTLIMLGINICMLVCVVKRRCMRKCNLFVALDHLERFNSIRHSTTQHSIARHSPLKRSPIPRAPSKPCAAW